MSVKEILHQNIEYWSPSAMTGLTNNEIAKVLNEYAPFLPGILSSVTDLESSPEFTRELASDMKRKKPFHALDDGRIAIWLSDDVAQFNNIQVNALPSGWQHISSIIHWLESVPNESICLLEEPETHLHPRLQRVLAQKIDQLVTEKNLQIFISTHSTVFQQFNVWQNSMQVFEVTANTVRPMSSIWNILDMLGIKGADISQSNGIIWVEGPSDRLYIKHWLKLWCEANKVHTPIENVDYVFSIYGGALLSHFSADGSKSFIDLLKINRNCVVVIDSDLDFEKDASGELKCKNTNGTKSRIIDEIKSIDSKSCYTWVTDGYTIESYLPDDCLLYTSDAADDSTEV
nr:AAA family ATPase [Chromobacterium sp. ASV23]